jgi:hypothetical protein
MSDFLAFVVTFGGVLALAAIVAATLLRDAGIGLAQKMILPAAMLGLGLYAPLSVNEMLGRPIATTMARLPDKATLIAYVPHDEAGLVDLWLTDGGVVPRAFEVTLDPQTKKTLREAGEKLAQGRGVALRKARVDVGHLAASGAAPANTDIGGGIAAGYVIDESASSTLPPKD